MSWKTPLARTVARLSAQRPGVLHHLLRDPRLAEAAGQNPSLVKPLLEYGVLEALLRDPLFRERHGIEEAARDWVAPEAVTDRASDELLLKIAAERLDKPEFATAILERIDNERLAEYLGPKRLLDILPPERFSANAAEQVTSLFSTARIVDHLPADGVLDHLGIERVVQHFGTETLLSHIDPKAVAQHVDLEAMLAHVSPKDPHLRAHIIHDQEALAHFLSQEDTIRAILGSISLRERFQFLDATVRAAQMPYLLPAAVVSYPRAGSNFLQNILMHSTGLPNYSIYAQSFREPSSQLLSVKSGRI